ncbi:MAG: thiol-disulfide oxidoreductase [Rhodobacterales bacterium]|nr:MAG: thiol-disulfide oxidoreductase [Rhodobacterales bacterium]
MKRRLFVGLGAAVMAASTAFGLSGAALAETTSGDQTASVIEMVMGAEDAPVTVVEYASFTCPHCASFHQEVLPQLKENYIDTGKVRFVYREAYFSKYDLWASLLARCGGQMRYFGIVDILMDDQKAWLGDGAPQTVVANLRKIGLTAGLTNEGMDACFQDREKVEKLVAWYKENFSRDDMNATPSFMIAGQKYANMGYEDFVATLDEKLAK